MNKKYNPYKKIRDSRRLGKNLIVLHEFMNKKYNPYKKIRACRTYILLVIHKCIHMNIQLHMLSYIHIVSSTLSTKEIIYNNHITWCIIYKFGIRLSHIVTCRSEMEICLNKTKRH
jgi:hypothetical protein